MAILHRVIGKIVFILFLILLGCCMGFVQRALTYLLNPA